MTTLCLKYTNVAQPYFKHIGSMTKRIKSLKLSFKNSVTQKLWVIEEF